MPDTTTVKVYYQRYFLVSQLASVAQHLINTAYFGIEQGDIKTIASSGPQTTGAELEKQ